MLYQPSYPYPYLSDIDATENNTFSCYINAEGSTTINAYDLTINDLSGKQIYTTTKKTLTTPLYSNQTLEMEIPKNVGMVNGQDYVWNVKLYEANANIWVAFGTIQKGDNTTTQLVLRKNYLISSGDWININSQKVQIKEYDAKTGIAKLETALSTVPQEGTSYNIYANNVKSNDYLFYARSRSIVSIDSVPSVLKTKSYIFRGNYSQAQDVGYKYFIWTLYNEFDEEIATTGEVNTGTIEYTFDGFASDTSYGIGLVVENQDGSIESTPIQHFTVQYEQPEIFSRPSSKVVCEKDAIEVSWTPLLLNNGVANGTLETKYEFVKDEPYIGGSSVKIYKDCDIEWRVGSGDASVYFDTDSTTYLNWNTRNGDFSGIIYKQEGEAEKLVAISPTPPTKANAGDKYYNTQDGLIYTAIDTNVWGKVGNFPNTIIMYELIATNQLYVFNGTTLEPTNYQLPSYVVGYRNNEFYYNISNGDIQISGSVPIPILTLWLLQDDGEKDPKNVYAWQDDKSWKDNLFWTENIGDVIDSFWFKITLLPTSIQVVANPRER